MQDAIKAIRNEVQGGSPQALLKAVMDRFGSSLVIASSLGLEDQVITHMAMEINPNVRVFVLDTGRLHEETYKTLAETREKLGVNYEIYFPEAKAVEELVSAKGINLFYESVENRKQCCGVRKVEPLNRVLKTADAWVTGLRQAQSPTRTDMQSVEWDESHQMIKINPLISWSEEEVWDYIRTQDVPYNSLHDKGFPSIGCSPCTRAIEVGEDIRAGRWWWEDPQNKECGLHFENGKLVRKPAVKKTEAFE